MKLKIKAGANIRIVNFSLKERIVQILKKLIDYKLQEFQRKEGIKNFRSKINREKKKQFLQNNTVNIFEFFYWYRIKANYRDLEFLNKDISSKQFSNFYKNYFELTINFLNTFVPILNKLAEIRLGRELFKYASKIN